MASAPADDSVEPLAQPMSEALQWAVGGLICCLTFGLGATLTRDAARAALKTPKAAAIGVISQYGWMPLVAFTLAKVLGFSGYKSVGLLVTGASPGGATSNLFCWLVDADVALSITMTVVSTLLSIGFVPLMLYLYTPGLMSDEADFVVPYGAIIRTLSFVLVPTLSGIFLRSRSEKWAKRAEKVGTTVGIAFLVGAFVIGIADNVALFDSDAATWVAAVALQAIGYGLGYGSATLAALSPVQRITVALEVMVQNTVLSLAVVSLSFAHLGARKLNEALIFPLMCSLGGFLWAIVVGGSILTYRKFKGDQEARRDDAASRVEGAAAEDLLTRSASNEPAAAAKPSAHGPQTVELVDNVFVSEARGAADGGGEVSP